MKFCPITHSNVTYIHCQDCGRNQRCEKFHCAVFSETKNIDFEKFSRKMDHFLKNKGNNVVLVFQKNTPIETVARKYADQKGYDIDVLSDRSEEKAEEICAFLSKIEKKGIAIFAERKEDRKFANKILKAAQKFYIPIRISYISSKNVQ